MKLTGILVKNLGVRDGVSQRTGVAWRKAEFLLDVPGQYVRHVKLDVSDGQQNRIARFDSMIGKTVTVDFDIDAHEYEGRWYNEVQTWGIMEYVVNNPYPQQP